MKTSNDFEEQVASYWEERDDFDARKLTNILSPRIKKLLDRQAKVGKMFEQVHDGVSSTQSGLSHRNRI